MTAQNKRTNGWGNVVWDIYRDGRFLATVEMHPRGLRVLLGAMMPAGKVLALAAIETAEVAQ